MRQAITRILTAGVLALGISGCVVSINDDDPDVTGPVSSPPIPMTCDAAPTQRHVGREATKSLGETILAESGARTLRWGPPDGAWTMDYREDRVNVRYDAKMKITDVTCG